jgi:hypothetical protein
MVKSKVENLKPSLTTMSFAQKRSSTVSTNLMARRGSVYPSGSGHNETSSKGGLQSGSNLLLPVKSNSGIELKRKAREKQYEKIKEYAIKYNVDEAMIYGLLSEYKSMQKIPADDAQPRVQ